MRRAPRSIRTVPRTRLAEGGLAEHQPAVEDTDQQTEPLGRNEVGDRRRLDGDAVREKRAGGEQAAELI